ncbi:alpha/beta hydrolase-fold protein [Brevibacillus sp. SYP-B805]|uniref:alpha/beta hydrolase n=1 Tax=Brevibacillus sp. SYP-B805 TaxID=1578199 RepID=UPI001F49A269|nr:alpha/beta hydrolase-fold protein [Brevibacillus sp. SYP-B805]
MSSVETEKGTVREILLASRHLGTRERMLIYTPPRYSLLYSYPVLYVQDGDDYLSLGRLATLLDQLIGRREITGVIAVFLPIDKEERASRYHPAGSQHQAYKRYLAEEVVSYVDTHYSTHPLGGARALLGESLGGVVSLFTALTYPHTFGSAASQSGAFDAEQVDYVLHAHGVNQLSLYLEVGEQETAVETARGILDLYAANRNMRDALHKKGATLRFETFAGDHTWKYWQETLPRILRHFYG